jgi:hypothetical protein
LAARDVLDDDVPVLEDVLDGLCRHFEKVRIVDDEEKRRPWFELDRAGGWQDMTRDSIDEMIRDEFGDILQDGSLSLVLLRRGV